MKVHLSATTLHNCLYPGIIPDHLRSTIKTTPEADKLISERALQGPARNGRIIIAKKYFVYEKTI